MLPVSPLISVLAISLICASIIGSSAENFKRSGGELILCSWHGALFDIESGRCVGGPCMGAGLSAWPVTVEGGIILPSTHCNKRPRRTYRQTEYMLARHLNGWTRARPADRLRTPGNQ